MELPDLSDVECKYCGTVGQIKIEYRKKLIPKPLGTYSLSGSQMKISATEVKWPWAVCGACGHESEGKLADED